ncbi:Tho Complex Subunit 2 [Manis pentadactyla]|nr:Tho Complex Subunit 2 [Manis pentadactyla]
MWALRPRLPGSGGAPRPPPRPSFLGKPEREADRQAEKQRRRGRDTHSACSRSKYSSLSGRRFRLLGAVPVRGAGPTPPPVGNPGPASRGRSYSSAQLASKRDLRAMFAKPETAGEMGRRDTDLGLLGKEVPQGVALQP